MALRSWSVFPACMVLVLVLLGSPSSSRAACPAVCKCGAVSGGYEVRCSGAAVSTIPDGLPKETTDLWLTNTAMTAVPPGKMTGMNKLRKMYIQDNTKLATVEYNGFDGTFNGATSLKELHMTGNKLKFVQPGAFFGLENLKLLNVSNNEWTTALAVMFNGLRTLEKLDLSNNKVNDMGDGPFSGAIPKLKVLDISSNGMTKIDAKAFGGNWQLEEIDISDNKFTEPLTAHLEQTKNLKWLDVSRNPFTTLQVKAFSRITSLETLIMNSMNDLTKITNNAFAEMFNLKKLEFTDNKGVKELTLRHLPVNNTALEEINLSNNTFKTLERALFMERENLTVLTLDNLPLMCDCKLSWMGEALQNTTRWVWAQAWYNASTTGGADNNSTSPVCATPENLQDVQVGGMVEEDFTCDNVNFTNVSTVNETMVNLTNSLTIQAYLYPGIPTTIWRHPRGWYLKGNRDSNNTNGHNITASETFDRETRQVVATLTITNITVSDLGDYMLIAANAAGNTSQDFHVWLEDDSVLSTKGPVSAGHVACSWCTVNLIICLFAMLLVYSEK